MPGPGADGGVRGGRFPGKPAGHTPSATGRYGHLDGHIVVTWTDHSWSSGRMTWPGDEVGYHRVQCPRRRRQDPLPPAPRLHDPGPRPPRDPHPARAPPPGAAPTPAAPPPNAPSPPRKTPPRTTPPAAGAALPPGTQARKKPPAALPGDCRPEPAGDAASHPPRHPPDGQRPPPPLPEHRHAARACPLTPDTSPKQQKRGVYGAP
jgi:hypothetical protein